MRGIKCKFVDASGMGGPDENTHKWVRVNGSDLGMPLAVSDDQLTFLERMRGLRLYGQLLIYKIPDQNGQLYSIGHMAVLTRATPTADPTLIPEKENIAWNVAADDFSYAPIGSAQAQTFLDGLDATAAEKAASNAAAESAAKKRAAYEVSPEYKRAQLRLSATQCQKTIANARAAIARDERVAAISGYENKLVREQAASMIVDCEDVIRRAQAAD